MEYPIDSSIYYTIDSMEEIEFSDFEVDEDLFGNNGSSAQINSIIDSEILQIKNITGNFAGATYFSGSNSQKYAFVNGLTSSLYNNGIAIFNNNHYLVIDDNSFNGSDPESNTSAYQLLEKNTDNGYIEEWDTIIYDIVTNTIKWRMDKRGNKINNSSQPYFQWGDNNIHNVTQGEYTCSINTLNNNGGNISGEQKGISSNIYIPYNTGNISFSVDGDNISLYSPSNSGTVNCHIWKDIQQDYLHIIIME